MSKPIQPHNLLALDVGHKRIGIAIASSVARLPRPLVTLTNDETFQPQLQSLIEEHDVKLLVVGLPRGLSGQDTAQTEFSRLFAENLQSVFDLPVHLQDEALTSRQAEAELTQRGKLHDKAAVDALAAAYIMDDFLQSYQKMESKHG